MIIKYSYQVDKNKFYKIVPKTKDKFRLNAFDRFVFYLKLNNNNI